MASSYSEPKEFFYRDRGPLPVMIYAWIGISLFLSALSLLTIIVGVIGLFLKPNSSPTAWGDLIVIAIGSIISLLIPLEMLNRYNTVQVLESGLRVRVFLYRYAWRFIPWEEVLSIELSPWPDRHREPIWVIKVKKLTIFHKLLSLHFLTGPGYAIIFDSDMYNRDELIQLVWSYID